VEAGVRAQRIAWFTKELKKSTKQVENIRALINSLRHNLTTTLKAPVVSIQGVFEIKQAIDLNLRNLDGAQQQLALDKSLLDDEVLQGKMDQARPKMGIVIQFPKVSNG
jgi:hypothetical protein